MCRQERLTHDRGDAPFRRGLLAQPLRLALGLRQTAPAAHLGCQVTCHEVHGPRAPVGSRDGPAEQVQGAYFAEDTEADARPGGFLAGEDGGDQLGERRHFAGEHRVAEFRQRPRHLRIGAEDAVQPLRPVDGAGEQIPVPPPHRGDVLSVEGQDLRMTAGGDPGDQHLVAAGSGVVQERGAEQPAVPLLRVVHRQSLEGAPRGEHRGQRRHQSARHGPGADLQEPLPHLAVRRFEPFRRADVVTGANDEVRDLAGLVLDRSKERRRDGDGRQAGVQAGPGVTAGHVVRTAVTVVTVRGVALPGPVGGRRLGAAGDEGLQGPVAEGRRVGGGSREGRGRLHPAPYVRPQRGDLAFDECLQALHVVRQVRQAGQGEAHKTVTALPRRTFTMMASRRRRSRSVFLDRRFPLGHARTLTAAPPGPWPRDPGGDEGPGRRGLSPRVTHISDGNTQTRKMAPRTAPDGPAATTGAPRKDGYALDRDGRARLKRTTDALFPPRTSPRRPRTRCSYGHPPGASAGTASSDGRSAGASRGASAIRAMSCWSAGPGTSSGPRPRCWPRRSIRARSVRPSWCRSCPRGRTGYASPRPSCRTTPAVRP